MSRGNKTKEKAQAELKPVTKVYSLFIHAIYSRGAPIRLSQFFTFKDSIERSDISCCLFFYMSMLYHIVCGTNSLPFTHTGLRSPIGVSAVTGIRNVLTFRRPASFHMSLKLAPLPHLRLVSIRSSRLLESLQTVPKRSRRSYGNTIANDPGDRDHLDRIRSIRD